MKYAECGCFKGEEYEEGGDQEQQGEGESRVRASGSSFYKKACFKEVGDGGREKENGDVEPIWRGADDAVIGVKEGGDQQKAKEDAS